MIRRRTTPRPKALWVQTRDAGKPAVKPRRRIRAVSKVQRAKNDVYHAQAAAWLLLRYYCEACCCRSREGRPLEVHHKRGRHAALLTAEAHWMALCRRCHNWIHDNPASARKRGWLAQPGEWGKL